MNSFSKKTLNLVLALTTLVSVTSCGKDLSTNQEVNYNTNNQNNSQYMPGELSTSVVIPDIQNVSETYAATVTETTAETILKKDEEKQVEQDKKAEEKAVIESKNNTVTTLSKPKPYVGVATLPGVKKYDLILKKDPVFINKSFFEPSALCFDDKGDLYTVADKLHYSLYKLDLTNSYKGYDATSEIKINKTQMLKLRIKKKNKFDWEGLVFYKGSFYGADERDRKVFKIDRNGSLTDLNIDTNAYMKANGIRNDVENSGLEGLTIDPVNEKMYLMKERQESVVLVVDMKTNKVTNHFKVALPGTVEPTLTDASFYNGFLYVLLRSHRQVLKMDPNNGNILSIYDYRKFEEDQNNVYRKIPTFGSGNDPEGYGVMEGLAVNKDSIYIASDNNMLPLKKNVLNNKPQLFIFSNPE